MSIALETTGYVAIGRNEGARLEKCLSRLKSLSERVVYVDSGSHDSSLEMAKSLEIDSLALDPAKPFSAARARNEGAALLMKQWPDITHILFIDGDCELNQSFVPAALKSFDTNPKQGIVTGFCREAYPEASLYNLVCDMEWRGPIGKIDACGGIFLIAQDIFAQIGRFNPAIIAAEDDELCIRAHRAGYDIHRINQDMCLHDANMHHFGQWWRRAERAGYAYALVGSLYPDYFQSQRRRAFLFAGIIPLAILVSAFIIGPYSLLLTALYPVSYFRTRNGLQKNGASSRHATIHAGFLTLSKFPNLLGILNFWRKKRAGKTIEIVEYK